MYLSQITPFVPCTRLADGIAFYTDMLGFEATYLADNYAFLRRDDVAVRLIEVEPGVDLQDPARQQSFYIDVQDIDNVYEQLAPRLGELPRGRVRAPFDQPYGQREFHVIDQDCTLIFFGETIEVDAIKPVL